MTDKDEKYYTELLKSTMKEIPEEHHECFMLRFIVAKDGEKDDKKAVKIALMALCKDKGLSLNGE